MDKEHVKGAADKTAGKIKEVAGHVTGNKKLARQLFRFQREGINIAGSYIAQQQRRVGGVQPKPH